MRRFLSTAIRATPPPWPKFSVSPVVRKAIEMGNPVVALESTIISHGMPYPRNVAVATAVEEVVRRNGATPATIAIIDGVISVGLSPADIERLGKMGADGVTKASRRDLGPVIAAGGCASTTVASTMVIAEMAGINVFVTGGIGGVHRGAETSFDISADLSELGRTSVAVVCAGVKSILDIGKTLEVLETLGVPVMGLSCKQFPAFFTSSSEFSAPSVARSPEEAARAFIAMRNLGLRNGMVLAVPNPDPADGLMIESAIQLALKEAAEAGITGKELTPYVLKAVNDKTSGASLEANVSLIMENARVGAAMAVEIASLRRAYSRPVFPRSVAPQVLITTANGQTPAHLIRAAPVSKSSTLKPAPAKSTKSVSQSVVAAASDDLDSDGSSDLESELDLSDLESEIDEEDNGSDRRAPASKGASKSPDWFSAKPTGASSSTARSPSMLSPDELDKQARRLDAIGSSFGPRGASSSSGRPHAARGGSSFSNDSRAPRRDDSPASDRPRSSRDNDSPQYERRGSSRGGSSYGGDRQSSRGGSSYGGESRRPRGESSFASDERRPRKEYSSSRDQSGGRPSYGSSDRSPRRSSDRGSSGGRGGGSRGSRGGSYGSRRSFSTASHGDVRTPLVVGGAVLDVMCKPAPGAVLVLETSNPGQVTQQFGGVGRNISECLARLGAPVKLLSAVGDDVFGTSIRASMKDLGIEGHIHAQAAQRTAVYSALINETGNLVVGIADMDVFASITPELVHQHEELFKGAGCVVADANLSVPTLKAVAELANKHGVPMFFEPTSIAKCTRAVDAEILPFLAAITPNKFEVFELANAWRKTMGLPVLDPLSKENPWASNAASGSDNSDEESSSEVYEENSKIIFKDDGSVDVLDEADVAAPEQSSEDDAEYVMM